MSTTTDAERRLAYIAGLREFADFLEQTPAFPGKWWAETFHVPVDTKEELAVAARTLGRCEKYGDDNWFGVRRSFGPHTVDVYGSRKNVCTRIVKGTREVTSLVADPAVKVPMVEVTETVEDVEWVCEPLLAPVSIIPPSLVPVGHEDYPEEIG